LTPSSTPLLASPQGVLAHLLSLSDMRGKIKRQKYHNFNIYIYMIYSKQERYPDGYEALPKTIFSAGLSA